MYRGSSRGPCICIIYTHPSRVGGIHPLFPPIIISNDILHLLVLKKLGPMGEDHPQGFKNCNEPKSEYRCGNQECKEVPNMQMRINITSKLPMPGTQLNYK